jgi:ABC-2 type transport system ATP-binding protein
MLGFVNLSKEKKNKIKSFSGGMKRRLSLAISAIGDPKIILLD